MTQIQSLKLSILGLLLLFSNGVWGADWQEFNQKDFEQAQAQGKTVVLDFHADWCSTCQKQKPILEGLVKEPSYQTVVGFQVDYDNSADLKKALKVTKQSTLVVYKGKTEVARQMGLTNKEEIKSLIAKGL